jgi:hypothetical protein
VNELLVLNAGRQVIQAVSLDGANVRTLVTGLTEIPDGIAVDHQRGHIYWTNMGRADKATDSNGRKQFFARNGSVERADLDGRNRRIIVPCGAFTTGKQLTADFSEGKLYWADREGMQVLSCDLDGSHLARLVVTAVGDRAARIIRNHCIGVAIDKQQRLVYWSQKGGAKSGEGRIFRAPIDIPSRRSAADRDDIELLWDNLPEPIDLHLADAGTTLIWTDRGAEPAGNTLNRACLDPVAEAPDIISSGYHEAVGVATADDVTYYVSDLSGSIRIVDLANGIDKEIINLGTFITGLAVSHL